jgi:hypothetical protein
MTEIGDVIIVRTLIENLSNATLKNVNVSASTNEHIKVLTWPPHHLIASIPPFATVKPC